MKGFRLCPAMISVCVFAAACAGSGSTGENTQSHSDPEPSVVVPYETQRSTFSLAPEQASAGDVVVLVFDPPDFLRQGAVVLYAEDDIDRPLFAISTSDPESEVFERPMDVRSDATSMTLPGVGSTNPFGDAFTVPTELTAGTYWVCVGSDHESCGRLQLTE